MNREKVETFFRTMRTPIDFEAAVGAANDAQQLTIIGSFLVIIGSGVLLLLLVENPWALQGRWGILLLGGFIFSLGLLFLWLGRRSRRALGAGDTIRHE